MARNTRFKVYIALIYFAFGLVLFTQSAPESSLVTKVPGFNGTFPSKHYAGYVTIDENHGRKLYYYFVVSERNPSKDPVVLLLNGGPGCSSFDGFVYDHGLQGAGHTVPEYKPREALEFYTRWLEGKKI